MDDRPGHRPHHDVVLLQGLEGTAVARRKVIDLELLRQ